MAGNYHIWKQGLSETSSEVTQERGMNVIPMPPKRSVWLRYLDKFKDPLIIILLVILVLSCAVTVYEFHLSHDPKLLFEPSGVLLAILLSTGLGFIFENKAEKEFDVLNQVKDDRPVRSSERRLMAVKQDWLQSRGQMWLSVILSALKMVMRFRPMATFFWQMNSE